MTAGRAGALGTLAGGIRAERLTWPGNETALPKHRKHVLVAMYVLITINLRLEVSGSG